MASCLGCYFRWRWGLSKSFTGSLQLSILQKFLALYSQQEHSSWTSIWPPVSTCVMDLSTHKAPSGSLANGHPYGFRWQHRLWTSAWLLMVTQATDINTAPNCSRITDPAMPPTVLSWATDINMAFSGNKDHH